MQRETSKFVWAENIVTYSTTFEQLNDNRHIFGHLNPRFYTKKRNSCSVLIVPIVVLTETFQCPICSGKGENALTLCNNGITYEICNREKPICEIAKRFLFGEVRVSRWCSDKETYEYLKGTLSTSTKKGFCTKSRCKAVLPGNQ